MLSMFSFEPSNGVSSLPCWSLEALRGLWCLWVWKENKVHLQFKRFAIIPWVFIFTMPRPVVWLWKWGSKYLKRGNQISVARSPQAFTADFAKNHGRFGTFHCRQNLSSLPVSRPILFPAFLWKKLRQSTCGGGGRGRECRGAQGQSRILGLANQKVCQNTFK